MVHQRVRGFAFLVLLAVTVLLMAGKTQAAGSLDTSFGGDGIVTTSDGQQAPLRCKVEILAEVGEA